MPQTSTCLWFDNQAEEAARQDVSVFPDARTTASTHHSAGAPQREAEQCGWLQDRFGLSSQIGPEQLFDMLQHPDAARRQRVMDALMGMKKLDLAGPQRAFM
ncbi:MAG TPA: VOC family protein [Ramlibacter sp.]|jgi:predicted 3-demethylubiquinone-9 3-methyltransferase (glyoxalase superfamily)|uniref:VOC family protein n=1 Tax=Ramlibacter sp. TaxID=1917967 RepID=UPI002D3A2073|nr:VOC family protein [Ramlibacter sp.]HZY17500.1 VOC family protein [Ramlibacter sp.]